MPRAKLEAARIAILAKAPVAGFAKTRLIPVIGAHAAAVLQERLTERAVDTALAAGLGPVTLWAAPNPSHRSFADLAARHPVTLAQQPDGDLGVRMLAAMTAANGPLLLIGTDCPALTREHLCAAAAALPDADAVVIPAEDGGYVLIGVRAPLPTLMTAIAWGTANVMAQTRGNAAASGLRLHEIGMLWDVDDADGLDRLERDHLDLAL